MGKRKPYKKCFTRPPKGEKPYRVYARKAAKRKVGHDQTNSLSEAQLEAHKSRAVHDNTSSEGFRGFDVPPCTSPLPHLTHHYSGNQTRDLTVVSLFDGIGTAFLVLKSLGLKVCKYYSSEIDEDCLRVQEQNFGDDFIKLGCVKGITTEILDNMGSVDLLVGGSPCSELSKVNWRRKGLYDQSGSGPLFFEFKRILNYLQKKSTDTRPLFWLFENTSAMDKKTKVDISSYALQLIVCAHVQKAFLVGKHTKSPFPRERVTDWKPLQSYLLPPKIALVDILPTITGNRASQCCGPDHLPPVLYHGKHEYLGPHECERLFGFPDNFTDCGLSISARGRCIGRSWSVDTVKSILQPLSSMFKQ